MEGRIKYVDAAKGIGILMIMLGHITKEANAVDLWMSSFKVTIFYIISGFLMSYSGSVKNRDFKTFCSKLVKSLVIPYISFSIIGIIFKTACVYLKHKPMAEISFVFQEYLYDSVFLKGINSMWFIPTLFIGEIVFFWLVRSPKAVKVIYAVFGMFAITASNLLTSYIGDTLVKTSDQLLKDNLVRLINAVGKGFSAAWFIGAGYLIYIMYKKIVRSDIKLIFGIILSFVNIVLSQINVGVDFNCMKEGAYKYLFYICGIIGSLGAIMILDFVSSHVNIDMIDYWGKNSLIVMCTHTVLGMRSVAYFGWAKVAYIPKNGSLEYICECLVVLIILMLIEYSIITIINKYCPFLIGRKKVIN